MLNFYFIHSHIEFVFTEVVHVTCTEPDYPTRKLVHMLRVDKAETSWPLHCNICGLKVS